MTNLLAMAPSGPFPRASQPRWFTNDELWLGLRNYEKAMIDNGTSVEAAKDILARLRQHGCERIFWREAQGGRRGRMSAMWDVRVAATSTPAEEAVPAVISMGPLAPGATALRVLSEHPAVLQAYSEPIAPQRIYGRRPILGSRFTIKVHVDSNWTYRAFAALARGHIGATISTAAESQTQAEAAMSQLVEVALRDIDEP